MTKKSQPKTPKWLIEKSLDELRDIVRKVPMPVSNEETRKIIAMADNIIVQCEKDLEIETSEKNSKELNRRIKSVKSGKVKMMKHISETNQDIIAHFTMSDGEWDDFGMPKKSYFPTDKELLSDKSMKEQKKKMTDFLINEQGNMWDDLTDVEKSWWKDIKKGKSKKQLEQKVEDIISLSPITTPIVFEEIRKLLGDFFQTHMRDIEKLSKKSVKRKPSQKKGKKFHKAYHYELMDDLQPYWD